jgi:peptidoglycan/LPS O-acetylase OafA/YrhL
MGAIRLLLALAVVVGHAAAYGFIPPYTPVYGLAPVHATLAVQMFYVISGFYMGLVLTEKYRGTGWRWRFYVSRYTRLMPAYLLVLVATHLYFGDSVLTRPIDTWGDVAFLVANVSLLGIDLTAFYSLGPGVLAAGQLLVPQAWSLGIELSFYLIVPALVVMRTRALVALAVIGLLARLAVMGTDVYVQQRIFPLELYFFVLGLLAHRAYVALPAMDAGIGAGALILGLALVALPAQFGLYKGWSPENALLFTAVFAVLLPFIFAYTRDWAVDRAVGELSYPVYLVHMLVGNVLAASHPGIALFVLATLAAAIPIAVLDIPVNWWRAKLLAPRASSRQPAAVPAG